MKAVVTGGGGFLGTAIVLMLHDRGDEVLAMGRRPYPRLESAGIRTLQADIGDETALRNAFREVDVVFHVAALTGIWGKRAAFWRTNVEGTRNVLAACRGAGVSRLVYTSSPSVVFGGRPLCGVDESQPYPDCYEAYYPETKAVAERMVLAANGTSLATVALRPHLIWGPGDPHLIPRVIERARRGRLRQVGDGTNLVDVTYIDNAAHAHVLAADGLRSGANCGGKAYFISQGEPVRLWPWLGEILARAGAPPIKAAISYPAARKLGAALEAIYRVFRLPGEPRMTRFLADQLATSHYFNISAAHGDLGYTPLVSMADGLDRMFRASQRESRT